MTRATKCYSAQRKKQEGTTLLVVMVLVLISTMLGISAMENSDVTSRLANNDRFRQTVFRAAEGKSNQMFSITNIESAIGAANGTVDDNTGIIANTTTTASLQLEGVGLARGFSLGEGVAGFVPYTLTSSVTVTIPSISAGSTVIQGARQYAPK